MSAPTGTSLPATGGRARTHRLVELSGPAAAAALGPGSVLVQPVGSIEHHGPHLPLASDLLVADALATAAVDTAAAAGQDVWLLPALAYTKSDEHAWAPGTIWLDAQTLLQTLSCLGESLAATPARRLVFLNGHGGNTALLQVACRELRRRSGLQTFLMPTTGWPSARASGAGGDDDPGAEAGLGIHGGHDETSLVLHLRPDLVHLELAARHVPEHLGALTHLGFHSKPVTFGWLSEDFGPAGVIGDPTGASAARGERLFADAVSAVVDALGEIAAFDPADAS